MNPTSNDYTSPKRSLAEANSPNTGSTINLEDVRTMWLVAGPQERYLLLEDLETGDVVIPLVYMKHIFETNYSRKLSTLKYRQVHVPTSNILHPYANAGLLHWQWAFESSPKIKATIKEIIGTATPQGHLRLILLPIIYNALVSNKDHIRQPLFSALHSVLRASSYWPLLADPSPSVMMAINSEFGQQMPYKLFDGPRVLTDTAAKYMFMFQSPEEAESCKKGRTTAIAAQTNGVLSQTILRLLSGSGSGGGGSRADLPRDHYNGSHIDANGISLATTPSTGQGLEYAHHLPSTGPSHCMAHPPPSLTTTSTMKTGGDGHIDTHMKSPGTLPNPLDDGHGASTAMPHENATSTWNVMPNDESDHMVTTTTTATTATTTTTSPAPLHVPDVHGTGVHALSSPPPPLPLPPALPPSHIAQHTTTTTTTAAANGEYDLRQKKRSSDNTAAYYTTNTKNTHHTHTLPPLPPGIDVVALAAAQQQLDTKQNKLAAEFTKMKAGMLQLYSAFTHITSHLGTQIPYSTASAMDDFVTGHNLPLHQHTGHRNMSGYYNTSTWNSGYNTNTANANANVPLSYFHSSQNAYHNHQNNNNHTPFGQHHQGEIFNPPPLATANGYAHTAAANNNNNASNAVDPLMAMAGLGHGHATASLMNMYNESPSYSPTFEIGADQLPKLPSSISPPDYMMFASQSQNTNNASQNTVNTQPSQQPATNAVAPAVDMSHEQQQQQQQEEEKQGQDVDDGNEEIVPPKQQEQQQQEQQQEQQQQEKRKDEPTSNNAPTNETTETPGAVVDGDNNGPGVIIEI